MRKELELIEKIEKYLKNELSGKELEAFQEQLRNDSKLHQEVALQQEVMQGVERAHLKQQVKTAFKKYIWQKNLIKWGFTIIGTTITALGILYYFHKKEHSHLHSYVSYELNEEDKAEWADADKYLPSQTFTILGNRDTIIETKEGILFSIPANCFLDNEKKPTKGEIELEIKEALTPASIINAGLSTKADDKLLETAGMFYINARKNGNSLSIDSTNSIYAQVPTNDKRADMKLFDGKRMKDGGINWTNPKALDNYLTPVDIFTLDFYPPGYLDSLKKWGYDYKNKKFTDSLYYSYANLFSHYNEHGNMVQMPNLIDQSLKGAQIMLNQYGLVMGDIISVPGKQDLVYDQLLGNKKIEAGAMIPEGTKINLKVGNNSARSDDNISNDSSTIYTNNYIHTLYGINPASVKTIWSEKFQNTIIATKEFEARMPLIHRSCTNWFLEVYVKNADKPLYLIDSAIASRASGELKNDFIKMAQRRDGKVAINSAALKKLSEYYAVKAKAFTLAAAKTNQEYWEKQNKLAQDAYNKKLQHEIGDIKRENQNLKEEYDINLTEACRQLGIKKPANNASIVYGVAITSPGWKNLDAFVMEATVNRTTLDYTAENGKRAVIQYLPVSFTIRNNKDYDRLYMYLMPDKLSSFIRLKKSGDKFEEKLNELMTYNMICIGYKGDDTYFTSIENIKPQNYNDVALSAIDNEALNKKLNALKSNLPSNDMKKEAEYWKSEIQEEKRKKAAEDKQLLYQRVLNVVLPCYTITDSYEME